MGLAPRPTPAQQPHRRSTTVEVGGLYDLTVHVGARNVVPDWEMALGRVETGEEKAGMRRVIGLRP
jgi:hypothetical protein